MNTVDESQTRMKQIFGQSWISMVDKLRSLPCLSYENFTFSTKTHNHVLTSDYLQNPSPRTVVRNRDQWSPTMPDLRHLSTVGNGKSSKYWF